MRFIFKAAIISLVVAALFFFCCFQHGTFQSSMFQTGIKVGDSFLFLVSLFFGFGIAEATE